MDFKNAEAELLHIGENIVTNIKSAIKKSNKINTGNLYNSVKFKLYPPNQFGSGGLKIMFVGANYVNFVLEGRKAGKKRPPIRAILSWINTPHGQSFFSKMKKGTTRLQAAFIVANSIKKKNISGYSISPMKQKMFVKATLSIKQTQGFKDLENAYRKDIEAELKKIKL